MARWQPTAELLKQFEEKGYFIIRNLIPRDTALEIRGVIRNHILTPENKPAGDQVDPMDPMGSSPEAQAARFRKLGHFCVQAPIIWHNIHANEAVARVAQYFLGNDLLLKFNSCFLKPARTGSATPWHQDNGLWRDEETEPFNFWMAIDPATRANGCLQFVPTSHKTPIYPHVLYKDSVHAEMPREVVAEGVKRMGLEHIELQPGDTVFWHSNLWHYSPPNTSEQSRIGVAGVYTTPAIADRTKRFKTFHWIMKDGNVVDAFPPKTYIVGDGQTVQFPPHERVEEPVAAAV
jgi:hypothetical protein